MADFIENTEYLLKTRKITLAVINLKGRGNITVWSPRIVNEYGQKYFSSTNAKLRYNLSLVTEIHLFERIK